MFSRAILRSLNRVGRSLTSLNRTSPYYSSFVLSRRLLNLGRTNTATVSTDQNVAKIEEESTGKFISSDVLIDEVKHNNRLLQLVWSDGSISRYPYIFLRENCKCPECFEQCSQQRKMNIFNDPSFLDMTVSEVQLTDDGTLLKCLWPDGHESFHTATWLHERRMPENEDESQRGADSNDIVHEDLICWDSNMMQGKIPQFDYEAVMNDDKSLFECLYTFYRLGLALLSGAPARDGVGKHLAARVGYLQQTHYGVLFDVMAKADPSNLAYTSYYLPFHTDLPFITRSPDIQVLHCIKQAPDNAGGDSVFVDAFKVAKKLMEIDYPAYEILSKTHVPFQDMGTDVSGEFHFSLSRPVFELNKHNRLHRVSLNNHVRGDKFGNLTPEKTLQYYEAYRQLDHMLYQPEYIVQHRLQPGQLVLFNNLRVLHSRTVITDATGGRWLQGHYYEWDVIFSTLRVLHARLGLDTPRLHADTTDFF